MTTYDVTDAELDMEIESARERISELQREKERRSELPEDRKLAEHLHSKQCHSDHTEGCSWFYEFSDSKPNWDEYTHARYLATAQKALESYDYDTIVGVLEAVTK